MNAQERRTPPGKGRVQRTQTYGTLRANGNAIDVLLSRLERVRPSGPDRWMARCPAHEDRTPSLSIKSCPDGVILLHCFAGCGTADILAAVGLELRDLFPADYRRHGSGPRPSWRRDQLQGALDHERLIVKLAQAQAAREEPFTATDWCRVLQAKARIRVLRRKLHG